jgi:2-(1,2-epoxy-1,2-dihydrophenyl)acetyl-CoA isomerase
MSPTVGIARIGDVTTLTLNRPDRLNAFNVEMHGALRSALAALAGDGTRCLVITGAGKGFCAGQDLSDRVSKPGDPPPDLGESLDARYNPLIRALKALPMPVVAAVNGIAAGAGANLALACDIVVAARSAAFVQSFCKVGLIPDSGGTWSLPRLVGHARATALMMLGDRVSAEQAEAWGMIWRCVDDESLRPEVAEMAAKLAAAPTRGLALLKKALARSGANTLDAQLDLERDLQGEAGRSDDYREGVAAFMEKRPPRFEGR